MAVSAVDVVMAVVMVHVVTAHTPDSCSSICISTDSIHCGRGTSHIRSSSERCSSEPRSIRTGGMVVNTTDMPDRMERVPEDLRWGSGGKSFKSPAPSLIHHRRARSSIAHRGIALLLSSINWGGVVLLRWLLLRKALLTVLLLMLVVVVMSVMVMVVSGQSRWGHHITVPSTSGVLCSTTVLTMPMMMVVCVVVMMVMVRKHPAVAPDHHAL